MADTAHDRAALRRRICDILFSAPCQRIDFNYPYGHGFGINRFRIDGSALSFVALALASAANGDRGIKLDVRPLRDGAFAKYAPGDNVLIVPAVGFGRLPAERNAILHECVHALRDALGSTVRTVNGVMTSLGATRTLDDEAAAYIAAALFSLHESTPPGGTPARPSWVNPNKTHFVQAFAIAAKIFGTPGATVAADHAAKLRKEIMSRPLYRRLKDDPGEINANDGIRL